MVKLEDRHGTDAGLEGTDASKGPRSATAAGETETQTNLALNQVWLELSEITVYFGSLIIDLT